MAKGLRKAIGVGIVSLPLIFGGCTNDKSPPTIEDITLQGTVFSECYMPATAGGFANPTKESRYSFSLDTEHGRKTFQVESTRNITKESVDALIEPGTKVEIKLRKTSLDQIGYIINVNNIKILP